MAETLAGAAGALAGEEPAAVFLVIPGVQVWHWPPARRPEQLLHLLLHQDRRGQFHDRNRSLTWSPLTESNRRPSPYHLGARGSLEVIDAGHQVYAGWPGLGGYSAVAALWCCTPAP
jgi:hypothetical protein